ncbi:hypothetical protein EJ994_11845 [Maribacter sp. MJ134]|jgi:hypothetical protein|uniref:hypothetical protein n=1 Tax=Maribacter sp. MJ134 TaxID=2496865 RepID=UPI000F83670F|nr:hypothetical protein [Maribacter sp. MJ134]AZQ59466.1 hypothetical protein EJ994_11845 [Maribacter sp. MJ134]
MEKSKIREKVLMELDNLISLSCKDPKRYKKFNRLHIALLKKHYNAADVTIDYHRNRVEMDIILDDKMFQASQVNVNVPTLYTNLLFLNLKKFLKSCIDKDPKSLGFYAQILRSFHQKENQYTLA